MTSKDGQMCELVGTWRSDQADNQAAELYGDVTLKFMKDGTLLYVIHGHETDQVLRLTFRVESGFIVTDQPSAPRPERTAYELTPGGGLVLRWGGKRSHYLRIEQK